MKWKHTTRCAIFLLGVLSWGKGLGWSRSSVFCFCSNFLPFSGREVPSKRLRFPRRWTLRDSLGRGFHSLRGFYWGPSAKRTERGAGRNDKKLIFHTKMVKGRAVTSEAPAPRTWPKFSGRGWDARPPARPGAVQHAQARACDAASVWYSRANFVSLWLNYLQS